MRKHELKCWPEPFAALSDGRKRFEVRQDDRGFAVGDVLVLHEWDPTERDFIRDSDRKRLAPLCMRVTYILYGGRFGLPENMCVMSLEPTGG